MSADALISVIIVNFNSKFYLRDCVTSLLQEPANLEIFVVDNASSDDSLKLVEEQFSNHPQITFIRNTENKGFSVANNQAVPRARGEYILFLNPDCVVKPGALSTMYQVMEQNQNVGMAGCLIRNPDGSIQSTCIRRLPNPWNSLVRALQLNKLSAHRAFEGLDLGASLNQQEIQQVEAISGAFMFVRPAALKEVGLMDEDYFLYCEDIDWMMRFHQKGWKILFVPQAEIIHAKSISSRQIPFRVLWYKHRGMIRFCHKFFVHQYPRILLLGIYVGIGVRFLGLLGWQSLRYLKGKLVKS